MKRSDLKKILKPIIKECLQESLLESGILSNIISEVVKGVGVNNVSSTRPQRAMVESTQPSTSAEVEDERRKFLQEKAETERQRRIKILNATGFAEAFEGVEPLHEKGSPSETSSHGGPLAGISPGDPGIDITGIMALGGKHWKKLVK